MANLLWRICGTKLIFLLKLLVPKRKYLAERGGFEPPVPFLTVRRFSKPLLSTTQPPLLVLNGATRIVACPGRLIRSIRSMARWLELTIRGLAKNSRTKRPLRETPASQESLTRQPIRRVRATNSRPASTERKEQCPLSQRSPGF